MSKNTGKNPTWRATPSSLWSIAITLVSLGVLFEFFGVEGAFAASGGMVVAITTPLFIVSLSRQSEINLDIKLALINLKKQKGLGEGMLPNLTNAQRLAVEPAMVINDAQIEKFEKHLTEHATFSAALSKAEAIILGLASGIWALGGFIANAAVHCGGKLSC